MKKHLTEAQKQAAQKRREQFRAMCSKVAAMTDAERAALAEKMFVVNVEGHTLSPHNQVLLAFQSASPLTVVGGFNQWRKMGRVVRKGEHGLMIWVPLGTKPDPNKQPGEVSSADLEGPGFIPATVFDIAQTEQLEA